MVSRYADVPFFCEKNIKNAFLHTRHVARNFVIGYDKIIRRRYPQCYAQSYPELLVKYR